MLGEPLPSATVAFAGGLLSLFFATAREALSQYSLPRLLDRLPDDDARSRVTRILEKAEDMAFSAAILKVLCNLLFVAGLFSSAGLGGSGTHFWVYATAFVFAAIGLLLVNEVAPRALAQFRPEGILLSILPIMARIHAISFPVIRTFNALVRAATRARGVDPEEDSADEIVEAIQQAAEEGEREGVIDDASAEMIDRIIEFKDLTAREVMTPRTDVVALDVDTPLTAAIARMVERGHSRIPVYRGTLDSVVGVLYVKDLLKVWGRNGGMTLKELLRPATFVPESQRIRRLLPIFKAGKTHFAIVTDEFGGTAGVITIEDVLEEIVGEIRDEYETKPRETRVKIVDAGVADVDGRAPVPAVNEALAISIPESADYDTIGGFVYSRLGRIPPVGEAFTHENLEFRILDADERRVNRIRIAIKAASDGAGDGNSEAAAKP